MVVEDFDSDGTSDLAIAYFDDNHITILPGRGDGTFLPGTTFAVLGNDPCPLADGFWTPTSLAVADFDRDGTADLVLTNSRSNPVTGSDFPGTVTVLLGRGDGTFRTTAAYSVGLQPSSVAVADLNQDGIPDIATANYHENSITVLLGRGDGSFLPSGAYGVGSIPESVVVGDFNQDGIPDLATSNWGDSTVSLLLGRGDGTFLDPADSASGYAAGISPMEVAVGDLNHDGNPDFAVANAQGNTVTVLLGHGDGTFSPGGTFGEGWAAFGVAVGDFNHDGNLDLATVNYNLNTVTVLAGPWRRHLPFRRHVSRGELSPRHSGRGFQQRRQPRPCHLQ